MNRLKDYAQFVGDDYVESLYDSASRLDGKSMVHVNSTYYGGGVAEMLNSYVPLLNDAGLATEWRLLKGSKEFFSVTKKIHNSLQGKGIPLSKADVECYEETIASNAEFTNLDWYDLVVVDDPQPCGLIKHFSRESPSFFKPLPAFLKLLEFQKKQPWVWRCHIDLSSPNRKTWGYLKEMLRDYDAIVVSARRYKTQLNKPHHYITPAIDPLSDKNRKLSDAQVERELKKNGIDGGDGVPLIVQVSRFDPWKDPLGVLEAFRRVRKKTRCKLVLIGSMASDDPEGDKVFQKVYEQARKNDDVTLITVQSDLLVNALQTRASVVVQKSVREGFGLTVSEAMWKGTPVVGSRVGGIPLQIDNGVNGYLADGVQECADRIHYLLTHESKARELGRNAIEKVRKNFLMPRLVKDEIDLFKSLTKNSAVKHLKYHQERLLKGLEPVKKVFSPLYGGRLFGLR